MAALFTELAHVHPGVSALADSLCRLSALPVCNDPAQRFAALHMIGFKNAPGQAPMLNLEWLLRRLPDPDQPGQYGCYDDATYLHALADERDTPLATLADVLQRRWFAHEKSQVLHLWLAAVDLAPVAPKKRAQRATPKKRAQSDGYERWKIYLRGEGRSLSLAHLAPFAHLHPNAEAGVRLLSDFYQSQQNLQLYGFALSLDSNNAYALNTYFIAE